MLVSLTDKKIAAIKEIPVTSFSKRFKMSVFQFQWKKLYVTFCHSRFGFLGILLKSNRILLTDVHIC